MDETSIWHQFLARWPQGLSREGVVVPKFGEQIPFVGFLLTKDLVVFERRAPDTVGARRVVMPLAAIEAVKITEPVGDEVLVKAGFSTSSAQQPASPV
jgi:hypothetical protein